MDNHIIAVCGGIGSGKSVVCRMLSAMGYAVYDCDSRAKSIMDSSEDIKRFIHDSISADAIQNGCINRAKLAEIIFNDAEDLNRLNKKVHDAVRRDILRCSKDYPLMFVETAILYQSCIDRIVSSVWEVTAPDEVRIRRVMTRSNLSREQIISRMNMQVLPEDTILHPRTFLINNDNDTPVLPRLLELINDELEVVGIHPRAEL